MSNYDPNYVYKPNFFVVGTKTVLTNKKNEILVLKRSGKVHSSQKWSLPGGACDENESPYDCAVREIAEETELNLTDLKVFAVNFHPSVKKPLVVIGYKGSLSGEYKVKLNWEHTEYKLLSKEEALKLDLTEDGRFFIENY